VAVVFSSLTDGAIVKPQPRFVASVASPRQAELGPSNSEALESVLA
jgi:hypothetical protein